MVEQTLLFTYERNYDIIFNKLLNDNDLLVKEINNIKYYKQGEWNNNKRIDEFNIEIKNIPEELLSIISMLINDNIVPIKTKIKIIEKNNKIIKLKIKANILNKLANLIFKFVRFKLIINIEMIENNKTKLFLIYKIKSLLSNKLTIILNNFIEQEIIRYYINIINNYLNNI